MSGEYGYRARPDMPDRFVTGGIAQPRNQWPRKVASGGAGDGGFQRTSLQIVNSSNARLGGIAYTGFGLSVLNGTVAFTNNGWWKNRTGYLEDLTGTTGLGRRTAQAILSMSPISMVAASSWPLPVIIRLSMGMVIETTTMAGGGRGGGAWLVTAATTAQAIPQNNSFGFASVWSDPDTYGAWSTWVASSTGAFTRASNTQFATNTPHLLEIEIDCMEKVIYWYVDGELVDSYAPAAADLPIHDTEEIRARVSFEAAPSCVTRCMYHMDTVPWFSVTMTDV